MSLGFTTALFSFAFAYGVILVDVKRLTCPHRFFGAIERARVQLAIFGRLCVTCILGAFATSMVRVRCFMVGLLILAGLVVFCPVLVSFSVLLGVFEHWKEKRRA